MYLLLIGLCIPIVVFVYLVVRGLTNFQATDQAQELDRNIHLLLDDDVTIPEQYQSEKNLKLCSTCVYGNPVKYTKCDNCYTNMTDYFILTETEIQKLSANDFTLD